MLLLTPSVSGLFKWRQFEPEVILLAVGWYLRFSLSYRDVEELLAERGPDATTPISTATHLVARRHQATPAQIALAWVLAQGDHGVYHSRQLKAQPLGSSDGKHSIYATGLTTYACFHLQSPGCDQERSRARLTRQERS